MNLKRRKVECMFGTFAALQKFLTSKAKRKKIFRLFSWLRKRTSCVLLKYITEKYLCVIKIYNITEKSK